MSEPAWMAEALENWVARLAGERELRAGVQLSDRGSVSARGETRMFLAGELTALGYRVTTPAYGSGANVIAELAATTGGSELVVVGAHFDSVAGSPGANDNATGTAATLAVARQLAGVTCRRRGALIALFDEEEVGLVGSTQLADQLAIAGVALAAVHTVDQVGWDGDGDRVIELEQPPPQLLSEYAVVASGLGLDVVEVGTGGTDHVPFRDAGFPAVGITEEYAGGDTTPFRHLPGDTYGTVDLAYLQLATRLVADVAIAEVAAE